MQGGFSIREYASRMRSINVVECWPFDDTSTEETVKSLLPPIVVKRFTWWLDELHLCHPETPEEVGISEVKPRKVSERGETSSRNAAADLGGAGDGWKASKLKPAKGKMRATKKRSIVEIFAVAPAVMGEEGEEEAEEAEEEEEEEEEEDDDDDGGDDQCRNVGTSRESKRKKRKDAFLRKASRVVKKIKRKKAEERRSKESGCKLNLRVQENASKEVESDMHDVVSNPKRKLRPQDLVPVNKLVPCKSSKVIEKNNRHLELPVRGILKNRDKEFSLKKLKKCILHETIRLNNCSIQKANKHVSFLENGENLRLIRKASKAVECLQEDFASDVSELAVGKYSTNSDTIGSEDASAKEESGPGATFDVDSTAFGKLKLGDECSNGSGNSDGSTMYTVNQQWPDRGLEDVPHNSMDVDIPSKEYYNSPNMKVIPTSSYAPCPTFPPLCFEDYLRTHNDASMSHMRRAYELTQAFPQNAAMNCAHPLHFQAFSHVSPNHLNGRNEEFVGLPLNSLGELIALNSCGKREVHNNMSSNVSGECVGHHLEYVNLDRRTYSTGQLNLFPVERNYVKENPTIAVLPSRLGITESRSEKANLDSDVVEINYHRFHNPEKTKSCENEKFQSTMRLMGKEFEVGRRGFDSGSVWKDKQIIDELHFSPNEPSFRQYRETLFSPSDVNLSKYALPQTSSTFSGVFLARTVDCGQKLPRSDVYNTKSLFSEPSSTRYDSQLRNEQNLHYSPIPSIRFPFMHPDFDGPQRSSLFQHPLCFDPSEKAAQLSNHPYVNESVPFQRDDFSTFTPLQPPLAPAPYYSGLVPVSAMQRQQNRIKSIIDIGKKSKASLSNAPFQSFKRSAVGSHEGHQCAVTTSPRFVSTKDGVGQILPWPDSYVATSRTGPVKTAAGAKHVLKHLHQQDHGPADTNVGFRFPESENTAEIYQV